MSETKEIAERLNRLARAVGRVVGIDVEVAENGDRLIFVDIDGEVIANDGEEIIAATPEEIAQKTFLNDFAARAFRAGMIARYQQIERSREP